MKNNYDRSIQLQCTVCGSEEGFEFNEDKSYVKCTVCGKEYFGGYDELVECNQGLISEHLEDVKKIVAKDAKKMIEDSFKKAFAGNKHIKFK